MKNKLFLGIVSAALLLSQDKAYALTGSANVEFISDNNVNVGDTFVIKMNVKDVDGTTDGIVSLEGNLVFDDEMIEYISTNEISTPYDFHINENYNYKLAGLDFTLENGILENTTVYEFTFKALKEGNTEITLNNYKLTDRNDYVLTTVNGKNINISEVIEEEKIVAPVVEEIVKEEKNIEIKEEIKNVQIEKEKIKAPEKVENEEMVLSEKIEKSETISNQKIEKQDKKIKNIFDIIIEMFNRIRKTFKK